MFISDNGHTYSIDKCLHIHRIIKSAYNKIEEANKYLDLINKIINLSDTSVKKINNIKSPLSELAILVKCNGNDGNMCRSNSIKIANSGNLNKVNIDEKIQEFMLKKNEYVAVFHVHRKHSSLTYSDIETILHYDEIQEFYMDSGKYIHILKKAQDVIFSITDINKIMDNINVLFAEKTKKLEREMLKILSHSQDEIDDFIANVHFKIFAEAAINNCKTGFTYDFINKHDLKNFIKRRGYNE